MSVPSLPSSTLVAALTALAALATPRAASAQMSLTSLETPVSERFGGWYGLGLTSSPVPGELDSRTWRVEGLSDGDSTWGGWHATDDFARGLSTGGVSTGGLYGFEVGPASNTALGLQPTESDATPGYVTLRVRNGTGVTVERVEVSFDACYYNDDDRSQTYTLQYSTDDVSYVDTAASSLTPEAASLSPAWVCVPFTTTLTGLGLSSSSYLYLRWYTHDNGGSGSRDELALDDVTVTALGECFTSADCDDGLVCTTDTCSAGTCVNAPRGAGTACGDGDVCNGAETCDGAGSCESSGPLDCDDGDPCTADSCDAVTGCASTPITGCGAEDAGVPDAGLESDAGTPRDGGGVADGGVDPESDAGGATSDGGVGPGADGGGVLPGGGRGSRRGGCSAAGANGESPLPWALAALILLGARRRRRP